MALVDEEAVFKEITNFQDALSQIMDLNRFNGFWNITPEIFTELTQVKK